MDDDLQDGRRNALSTAQAARDRSAFVRDNTAFMAVPLVPEIHLYLASEAIPLWQRTEDELGAMGLPPPFWAFAWAGGQALARYILDNPHLVAGKRVLDLGAGSGLTAIAAAKAGAAHVEATEIDAHAGAAIVLNAQANEAAVAVRIADLLEEASTGADIVLAGDLFYEKAMARRALAYLTRQSALGANILIGDPGRSYLPKDKLEELAVYSVPVSRDLEDMEIKRTAVWGLAQGPRSGER